MRVFIGLPLSEDIKSAISTQIDSLRAAHAAILDDFRWVDPKCYHITLLFIGEVPMGAIQGIKQKLVTLSLPSAFHSELGSFERFPQKKGPPRVLIVSLKSGGEECRDLYRRIAGAFGESVRGRSFTPHITVARSKRQRQRNESPCRPDYASIFADAPDFEGELDFTRIVLFESRLSSLGARYAELGSYDLALRGKL